MKGGASCTLDELFFFHVLVADPAIKRIARYGHDFAKNSYLLMHLGRQRHSPERINEEDKIIMSRVLRQQGVEPVTSEHPTETTTSRLACSDVNSQRGKPTVLLIHGACGCGREWDLVTPYLSDDYHVLLPDLPGHGDSR